MRFPGRRTIGAYSMKAQAFLYHAMKMSRVTEEMRRVNLAEAMGFDGQWDDHREFQMAFLQENGLNEQTRFLEIGSGPLTLGIPLIQLLDAGNYTGVDIRENVSNLAYNEIARAGLARKNPRLIVSDNFGASSLGDETFDVIWSFSVLFHLSDDLVNALFSNVKKRLSPKGRYWANYNNISEESQWLEFPFVNRTGDFYERIAKNNGLSYNELGAIQQLGFNGRGQEKNNVMFELAHA
ncbi:Methyltransferase domain-containing protein [Ruegeria halocynthiae]|uniref:Methyltransferase domain-containing protein n=1 Tax=Ruegeria halocynthiae TaxID=985054 RepID=A0A1H2Y1U1_9RHOB|nr:class I SAM-dependent methyltransferase [Ruegeria halocynthiae]SDW99021.1 Methyltransferase domain-containing protein [Ruegeria halocynthiae]